MGHRDAQLLVQLADQAGLGRLARLDLAAGEFPQAGQLLALRPLADQHPAVDVDQGRGGDEERWVFGHAAPLPTACGQKATAAAQSPAVG